MSTKKTDSPQVHASLAKLRKEGRQEVEPFQLALDDSRVVTFPDPFARDAEEAEELFWGIQTGNLRPTRALRMWLSEEDGDLLFSQGLTFRDLTQIVQAAMAYFESTYGPQGEGSASRG